MITVRNRLEIRPGNIIQIPGCEPASSLSGTDLSANMSCNSSVISLSDAIELIPGSRIVKIMKPIGQISTGYFLELPSNTSPPDGFQCNCTVEDYYQILRDNASEVEEEDEEPDGVCSGFDFSGCVKDFDVLHTTRDPVLRPNSNPL